MSQQPLQPTMSMEEFTRRTNMNLPLPTGGVVGMAGNAASGPSRLTEDEKAFFTKFGWTEGQPLPANPLAILQEASQMPDLSGHQVNVGPITEFDQLTPKQQEMARQLFARGVAAMQQYDAAVAAIPPGMDPALARSMAQNMAVLNAGPTPPGRIKVSLGKGQPPVPPVAPPAYPAGQPMPQPVSYSVPPAAPPPAAPPVWSQPPAQPVAYSVPPAAASPPPAAAQPLPTEAEFMRPPAAPTATAAPALCRNCGAKPAEEPHPITDEDRRNFLVYFETQGATFVKTFELYGGRSALTFRIPKSYDAKLPHLQAAYDHRDQLLQGNQQYELVRKMIVYDLLVSLDTVKIGEAVYQLPAVSEIQDWTQPAGPAQTPLRDYLAWIEANILTNASMVRMALHYHSVFKDFVARLEAQCANRDFLKGIATPG